MKMRLVSNWKGISHIRSLAFNVMLQQVLLQASDLVTKVLEDRDDYFRSKYFCNAVYDDRSYRTRPTSLLFTAPDGQKDKVCL